MKKKLWLFIFAITAFMSCSAPKDLEYINYQNFSIQQLGFNNSAVSLNLQYYNPNNFGMQLKNTDLDIFINGNLLGHSSSDSLIHIPRRDTFYVPVKFNVNMQTFFKNALNTLFGKEILVRLTGRIRVGKANIFKSFPVDYETEETFSLF